VRINCQCFRSMPVYNSDPQLMNTKAASLPAAVEAALGLSLVSENQ
jgi:hypothetical protein